jgi:ATP-dependent DNA helicase RecG
MSVFPRKEDKKTEFKVNFSNMHGILKTCTAFANTAGGSVFVGIDDQGQIEGLSDETIEHQLEGFYNTISQAISPLIIPNLVVKNFEKKSILEIQIAQGGSKPYYLKSEGSSKGIYLRSGRSTIKPAPEDLKDILLLSSYKEWYDASVASHLASDKDLDAALLRMVYPNYATDDLCRESVLVKDIDSTPRPTLAALMVFGHEPQKFLHERGVIVTKFSGIKGRNIVRSHELSGSIGKLTTDVIHLINEYTTEIHVMTNKIYLGPKPFFPEIALRELILNALIHRKYQVTAPIKVAIYDDRVEIFSPGELPPAISLESLGDGTSQIRNVHIAKFARKVGLMEKLGSGIREAKEALAAARIHPPLFIEQATSFKCIIFRAKAVGNSESPRQIALDFLQGNSWISKKDLVKSGVSDRNASLILKKLSDEGLLEREGAARSTRFRKKLKD